MQAMLKDAQQSTAVTVCEISFIRTLFALFASIIFLLVSRQKPLQIEKDLVIPLIIRSMIGAVAFIITIKTISMIPLTVF